MKVAVALLGITKFVIVLSLPFKKTDILQRKTRSTDGYVGCMHMEALPGDYRFEADGSSGVCGLYLIAKPDELIQIEFTDFSIDCESGGLLALVDGWELNGQFFPNAEDHPLPVDQQYQTFCGENIPRKRYISSQNVALIQNHIPTHGQGFKIHVKFFKNPQPCNAVSMAEAGEYSIKNYGQRRNCTLSIIYPEVINLMSVDVGASAKADIIEADFGLTKKCQSEAGSDFVEVMGGYGFDTSLMNRNAAFCGLKAQAAESKFVLACDHAVVRMVSSGKYYNTITFVFSPPVVEDLPFSQC